MSHKRDRRVRRRNMDASGKHLPAWVARLRVAIYKRLALHYAGMKLRDLRAIPETITRTTPRGDPPITRSVPEDGLCFVFGWAGGGLPSYRTPSETLTEIEGELLAEGMESVADDFAGHILNNLKLRT